MKRSLFAFLIIAALAIAAGCSKKPAAVVNGEEISMEELDRAVAERVAAHATSGVKNINASEAMRSVVLDALIGDRLLLQGAKGAKITVEKSDIDSAVAADKGNLTDQQFMSAVKERGYSMETYRAGLRDRIMIERFVDHLAGMANITDEDIRKAYKEMPTPLIQPATVEVRFIELSTEAEAEDFKSKVKTLKEFDARADQLRSTTSGTVSEYGLAMVSFFTGEIAEGLKNMKENSFGGPYKSKAGTYYMIALRKRHPERPKTLAEATPELRAQLFQQRRNAAASNWVAERGSQGKITKNIN